MESLKRARKAGGMSLAEMGEATGIHPVSIARAERPGLDVRVSTVRAICHALGLSMSQFFATYDERKGTTHGRRTRKRR